MLSAADCASDCQTWISEAVNRRRDSGAKRAMAEVARLYRLNERRVIAYLRGEVNSPPAHEYLGIKQIAREDLAVWIARHQAEAEKLRARLAEWDSGSDAG